MPSTRTPDPHARVIYSSVSDNWPARRSFFNELSADCGFVLDACNALTGWNDAVSRSPSSAATTL